MEFSKRKILAYLLQYLKQSSRMVIIGAIVIVTIFFINQIKFSKYFPINRVSVYGLNHVDQQEVQSLITPLVKHGFFNVKIDYIRERLLQMPWVADTVVRRKWPGQVEVTILEKQAIARWNQSSLLSQNGELFHPAIATYPKEIPDLLGPNGKQVIMMEYFAEINRLLSPLHAKISSLELSPYFTWKLTLDNGITIRLGHKDILIRLTHFVKVYPKIIGERTGDVEYIDLRYANGMAVQWKTPIKL